MGNKIVKLSVFSALAMILSYVELLIPLTAVIPLPAFKLGLANIAVTLAFFLIGKKEALLVSLVRIILTSILFSNPVTLFFSLVGGIFAYSGLLISSRAYDKNISFIGISVFCAALHNFGQNIAAIITFTSFSAISYLPYLLLLSVPTGIISGVILELVFKKVKKLL